MIEDLFVPDPPAGDSSNRIADTRFVQSTIASAIATAPSNLPSITGLSVIGNASTAAATAAAITGAADQLLAVNHAATTVLFTSASSFIDNAVGSTAGQILYRNAATWVQAGGMVLLNTLSPNGVASTNDTSSLTATFRNYMITFENVCPATQTTSLLMRLATSGANFLTTGYFALAQVNVSSILVTDSVTSAILLSGTRATAQIATSTVYGLNGSVMLFNPAGTVARKGVVGTTEWQSPGTVGTATIAMASVSGYQDLANAITGVNFLFNSGNIQTGTIKIYGIT